MKKILAVCLGLFVSFGLFACDEQISESIKNSETEGSSDIQSTPMDSSDKDSSSIHEHNSSKGYKSDASSHWKECDCNVKFDVAEHDYNEFVQINVTYDGILEERTCKVCGYLDSRLTPCDHQMKENIQESTCLEEGFMTSYCSLCGFVENHTPLPLGEHSIANYSVVKNATCLEVGEKQGFCDVCKQTISVEIPKTDHDYEHEITKYPTCSEEGTMTYTCKICKHSETEDISKVPHSFKDWVVTEESTCSTHGVMERECAVCNFKEEAEAPYGEHAFGEWYIRKEATIHEEGEEVRECEYCDAEEIYKLDKLQGYTITVSGGTVNKIGENVNQNTIYVGEGEIVEIKANEYAGYTFYQWFSDGAEIIPTSSFKLLVNRNTYFYICFEEDLNYGEWILQQEATCTQDGLYYRLDERTGLKQFMVNLSRGHNLMYGDAIVEKEPTCLEGGLEYYKCEYCDYKEYLETNPKGHTYSKDYKVIEEAYGPKVGLKETSCVDCGAKKTKEYIKAVYPDGNLKITFNWDNRAYVSSADRDEIHWMMDGNKYVYYVMRDSSGHVNGNYVHFYFYYEDKGPNSPVFVKKLVGDKNMPKEKYVGNGWGLIAYVDSFEEFIEYIDDEHKGKDNGANNTSLYFVYKMWEEKFNEAGGIPNGFYCEGVTDYLGYKCRVYTNDYFAYYVNEDNCCLWYSGMKDNRDFSYVSNIEQITEMPFEYPKISETLSYPINIEYGSDYSFADQYYFQIENLNIEVEIYESNYISKRKVVKGYEVQSVTGEWIKIDELVKVGTHWEFNREINNTYKYIVEHYLKGVIPETIEIRPTLEDAELPVHVKVTNGYIYTDNTDFGSEENFLANQEIVVCPARDYDGGVEKWIVNINGKITEYEDYYNLDVTLPESGNVLIECVFKQVESIMLNVTINVVGNGTVNKQTGQYAMEELELFATSSSGNRFIGWYVQGLYSMGGDDIPMMLSSLEEGEEELDYSLYGEFFSSKARCVFPLFDSYDENIIITAIFEEIDIEKDCIDIVIEHGFVYGYSQNSLMVSALRLSQPDYIDIFPNPSENERIVGWTLIESTSEGDVSQELDGKYVGYYFENDSSITPIYAE